MKQNIIAVTGLLASTTSAYAAGLDRSGQDIGVLFETGNHLEFSAATISPVVDGRSRDGFGPFSGISISDVADTFQLYSFGLKYELNDQLSFAVVVDQPYGSDVIYPGDPATSLLGGTGATVDSFGITALARYKFNENFSVYGGVKYQEISANVTLGGQAFGGLNGYEGDFDSDGGFGYVLGAAYEIPDIALRVALTYQSKVKHNLRTTETINGVPVSLIPGSGLSETSNTSVDTPENISLSFQSGVAKDTLVFGNIRYSNYDQTVVRPAAFTALSGGNALTDLENAFDIELGIGRRFNEKWSGSLAVGLTTKGDDDFVSPLDPRNGSQYFSLGVKYDVNERVAVSGGIRYTELGDAIASPGGNPVADFKNNSAVSFGLSIGIKL